MANPLSPLSSSFQNARARSPKVGSSPFLAKTVDEQPDEHRAQPSPLKNSWADYELPSSPSYHENENYPSNDYDDRDEINEINDNNDFQESGSSPFRYDGRDDTVDFKAMKEYQQHTPSHLSTRFEMQQEDDPMSSPFRPDTREETVDFQRLREEQPLSPGLSKRLAFDKPPSSPFRPEAQDDEDYDEVDDHSYEVQPTSPGPTSFGLDGQPEEPMSSPFRAGTREETVNFQRLEEFESKRESLSKFQSRSPSPMIHSPPIRQTTGDDTLEMKKLRSSHRASLSTGHNQLNAATPRKRSFDQTPQDYDDDAIQPNDRAKKGMLTRAEEPEIHIHLNEESSVVHEQSLLSTTSATQDRSTIANSMMEDKRNEGMSTVLHDDEADHNSQEEDDIDPMDETGLSTFSVLPDMTSFAKLRAESPMKSMRGSVDPSSAHAADMYRRSIDPGTPGTARRSHRVSALLEAGSPIGSPTPRRRVSRDVCNPNDGSNLLDFTDQVSFFPRSTQQTPRYSPQRSPMRNMRQSMRSPSKLSLLDFDIPAAPTPRSIPTVTPRELESLKSGFMSEISSLKATLSGKEAEVASLKTAVGDAERRVGEALEEIRNEAARREAMEIEQAEWDLRGKEMERVLQSVRDELDDGERERDRLTRKAEDAEKGKEKLEGKIVELETQLSTARSSASSASRATSSSGQSSQSAEDTAREVQDAVEKVARELHTLYKGKHETKVAALKKSYESRWEKRLREADGKLTAARKENEKLKAERDASNSDSMAAANVSMIARENDEHEAEKHVFEAQIKGLQHEMAALKQDSEQLRADLKSERAEKGELVAAVDEWLAIQQGQPAPVEQERQASVSSAGNPEDGFRAPSEPPAETFHRSVSRSGSSGIRPPSTAEKKQSRIGAPGGHSRGNSGGKSGIAVFTPGRGGILSSIERMGRGGV
ncbi:hypothetical protein N7478_002560 [Penicillium angulare]|uniref:uncharacterized protein n=1 Tax=Penicillium angulare TaxID=116970 RepID=UPI0025408C6B|nr:uncharacterized protein N7478_002560 [Penicillium angulare]KAJ5286874.1 hypothetical protein N7478_002560 [Penicillium angulare]